MNFLLILAGVFAYKLLPEVVPTYPKTFQFCNNVDNRLEKTFYQTAAQISRNGYPVVIGDRKVASVLCNSSTSPFGVTYYNRSTFTATLINNKLLNYPKAMYNVLLHELLHTIGLDHNNLAEPGMMSSYSLNVDTTGKITEDTTILWPSLDDCRGLAVIKSIAVRD